MPSRNKPTHPGVADGRLDDLFVDLVELDDLAGGIGLVAERHENEAERRMGDGE